MTIRDMAMSSMRLNGFGGFPGVQNPGSAANRPNQPAQSAAPVSNQAIRDAGREISEALGGMQDNRNSVFATLEGRTSNADAATVQVNNSRTIQSMPPRDTTINVTQVAQAQVNTGEALTASSGAVTSGGYRFSISVGGNTQEFTLNVLDSDDNASVQRAMAEAINRRGMGVTATVQTATDSETGAQTSTLTLTANQTGTGNAFTVNDITGNLAASMGVTTASQTAQNAVFTLNGGAERQSQTNDISLAAGVTATIRGVGEAQISFGRSAEQAVSAVTDLVGALNNALRNTNPNDGRGSARFVSDIQGMNRTFAPALSRVGIDVGADGRLSINQDRLQRAAQDGSLERVFGNQNMGFAGRANRIANNAASGAYRNAPTPVPGMNIFNNNSGFDFGNTFDSWNMMNLFG